jgi:hypothetical protein
MQGRVAAQLLQRVFNDEMRTLNAVVGGDYLTKGRCGVLRTQDNS